MARLALALLLGLPPARAGDGTVVDADLDAAVAKYKDFWGAVLVARRGKVLHAKGYGFADYDKRPNTPDTLFEIASVSKSFTAAAILRLQMEGRLKASDPLGKHLRGVPKDKRAITIHHLLTHTSGLSPDVTLPYASPLDRKAAVRFLLSRPLASKVGEKFAYCNGAYALLAAIVEVASKGSFESYSRKRLFAPAGMKDTGFINDRGLDAGRMSTRLARSGARVPGNLWFWSWGYRGMGGVITTVYDLHRWDRALRAGRVLDEDARKRYYTPAKEEYALGWRVELTTRGTRRASHSGGVAGYGCSVARYLEDDVLVVVLSNGHTDFHAVAKAIEQRLFPPPKIEAGIDVGPYELTRHRAVQFEGQVRWDVVRDGDAIVLRLLHTKDEHEIVRITAPRGVARKLTADLARTLAIERPGGGPKNIEAGVYLRAYRLDGGRTTLGGNLELHVLPRYTGRDEKGNAIVDERATLILADRGMWPLMVKMNRGYVQTLLNRLRKALAAAK